MQPNDRECRDLLIQAYQATNRPDRVTDTLLDSVERGQISIEQLARLQDELAIQDKPDLAERDVTTMVELHPLDTDGHAKLAEIRENQSRWDEAADQWRQVARLRSLEPTGLLNLARIQILMRQRDKAQETLHNCGPPPGSHWIPRSCPRRCGQEHSPVARELRSSVASELASQISTAPNYTTVREYLGHSGGKG